MAKKTLSKVLNAEDTKFAASNECLNSLVADDVDKLLDVIEKDIGINDESDDEESVEGGYERSKFISKYYDDDDFDLEYLQSTFLSNTHILIALAIFCFGILGLVHHHKNHNTNNIKAYGNNQMIHNYKTSYEQEANQKKEIPCDYDGGFFDCRNQRGKAHKLDPDELTENDLNEHMDEELLKDLEKEKDYFEKNNTVRFEDIDLRELENMADLTETYDPSSRADIPLFFHVPRAAGIVVEDIFSHCYNLVEVSQVGVTTGHWVDKSLEVLNINGGKYVNIDSTTRNGIQKAKNLNLASSGLADVIFTSYLYDASNDIFSPEIKGRCFALLRHPVERAISLYYYRKENEPYYKDMSFYDYMHHGTREDNWMTRFLSNKEIGTIYEIDFLKAKKVLKTKCLVGFVCKLEKSMKRFERYFHWNDNGKKDETCFKELIEFGENANKNNKYILDNESEIKSVEGEIVNRNYFDLKLFEYAKNELFNEQEAYIYG